MLTYRTRLGPLPSTWQPGMGKRHSINHMYNIIYVIIVTVLGFGLVIHITVLIMHVSLLICEEYWSMFANFVGTKSVYRS